MIEPSDAQLFFTLLTFVANAALAVVVVVAVASRFSGGARRSLAELRSVAGQYGVRLAFAVAATCMLGSLYFSEVANYVPCTMCWYQRIAMYPVAILLGVALVRRQRAVRSFVVPLVVVGLPISIYHYFVEWFPDLESGVCSASLPCSIVWFRRAGFVSLPYMAASGFALVAAIVLLAPRATTSEVS